MKKPVLLSLFLVFALAGLAGFVFAADQAQEAIESVERQLYAKQAELDALRADPRPDVARVQQLFSEIGELQGRLFAARAEQPSRPGYSNAYSSAGFFGGGCGFAGNRGGYRGHRGGGYGRHWGGGYGRRGGGCRYGW